jgi:hypothetical protein
MRPALGCGSPALVPVEIAQLEAFLAQTDVRSKDRPMILLRLAA